ncbi:MAG TPA: pitrilysin family protein [Bryobacteraceae bacterium]|nr:pitrilysin family protein [Bryobacteraceae bacterium]
MSTSTFSAIAAGLLLVASSAAQPTPPPAKPAAPKPATASAARVANLPKDIVFPKLNDVKVPQTQRFTLANGMTVFLLEDHELPTVRASALIRTGSRYEPAIKTGIASITAEVMRSGGSTSRPGDKLDDELDRLAANVEFGMSRASGTATISCLKEDAEKAFVILADLLQHPAFPQDKIDLEKQQTTASIARRNDDAMGIHGREMRRLVYGKLSPYAGQVEYATINAITREDLMAFHKKYYQPENVILGVWGDFDAAAMKALVERTLGAWPKGGNARPPVIEVDPSLAAKPGVYFIEKSDVNQSNIGIIRLADKQNDPGYYTNAVMADILGGGFASRLFNKIRTEMGLAYASTASYSPGMDIPGTLSVFIGTKSETTMKAIEAMKGELAKMAASEVTDAELKLAKESILKGEAFDYASTGQVINRLMGYEYYGYPPDFLQKFRAGIEKVTKADVLASAQKWLKQEDFVMLVLGKAADFDQPLSKLGPVTPVDISIPQPEGPKLSEATPEAEAAGKALLAKVKAAHGGAAIDAVKAVAQKAEIKITTPQGEMAIQQEATVTTDGKQLLKLVTPMGEMLQGFDGEKAWGKQGANVMDAPPNQAAQAKQAAARDTVTLLQSYAKPGYKVQALSGEKLEGKDVDAVAITNEAAKQTVKFLVDPATGMLTGKSYTGSLMGQPGTVVERYLSFTDAGGIKLPSQSVSTLNGNKVVETTIKEWKVNPDAPASAFAKPQ